jgi:uncharacterized protein YndB with AHSA1/START domain
MKIEVEAEIAAAPNDVWDAWISPDQITKWNFASDDWCCPRAEIDLKVGGRFKYRMEAKDGTMGFDFEGVFVKFVPQQSLHFETRRREVGNHRVHENSKWNTGHKNV